MPKQATTSQPTSMHVCDACSHRQAGQDILIQARAEGQEGQTPETPVNDPRISHKQPACQEERARPMLQTVRTHTVSVGGRARSLDGVKRGLRLTRSCPDQSPVRSEIHSTQARHYAPSKTGRDMVQEGLVRS